MFADFARRHGIFYGWVIVACAFMSIFVSVGICVNCWGIFTIPVCDTLGITRQDFSSFVSSIMFGQMIVAFLMPKMIDTFTERGCMRISAVVLPAALICISLVKYTWQLLLLGILIGYMIPSVSFLLLTMLISNWFYKLRGTAIGIVVMGSGISTMIFSPIVTAVIQSAGWRAALIMMAAITAAILIPICYLLIIARPEDVGLYPDGADSPPQTANGLSENSWGLSRSQAVKSTGFWLFIFFVFANSQVLLSYSTIVPYLCDIGYNAAAAAKVYSLCMAAIAFFRFFGGRISDKIGLHRAFVMLAALAPFAPIGLILAEHISFEAPVIALGIGVGNAVSGVYYSLMVGKLFGRKHFAQIFGIESAFSSLSCAIAPTITGAVYTRAGTYLPSYWIILTLYAIGFICFFVSCKLQNAWKIKNGIPLN